MSKPKAPMHNLVRFTPLRSMTTPVGTGLVVPEGLDVMGFRESGDDHDGPGTIFGYPIVFDVWTEINSWWEGNFLERIHPSSIDEHLAKRGDRIRNLFQHGFDPQIGDKPIGKPKVQEAQKRGLYSETPLSATSYNTDLAALIRDGAIDGQSFRFSVLDEEWHAYGEGDDLPDHNPKGLDERTVTRMVVPEYGPVTFPAYEAASVGIRTAAEYVAWQQADDDLRAAMIMAKLEDVDPDRVRDVVQRMRNGDPLVQMGDPTEATAEVETPPADGDEEREEMGTPGHRSHTDDDDTTSERVASASRYAARAAFAMREAERYAGIRH